jgi:hypothetical protein
MALSYTDDPPDSELTTPTNAAKKAGLDATFRSFRAAWTAKGIKMATVMGVVPPARPETSGQNNASPANGPRIVMFRYLPTILDIAMTIEDTPDSSSVDPKVTNAAKGPTPASQKSLDDRVTAGVIEGRLALTYAFLRAENRQYYEQNFMSDFVRTHNSQFADPSSRESIPAYLAVTAPAIPAGSLGYGPSNDLVAGHPWYEADQNPSNNISYVATPFYASALAENPQNIRLSQILVNKLAASDIAMKFLPKTESFAPIFPNYNGIPQLYWFTGDTFNLFAPGVDPNTFLKDLRLKKGLEAYNPMGSILDPLGGGLPQVLRMRLQPFNANEIANNYYRVTGTGGEFWLPFGHFVMVSESLATAAGERMLFVKVQSKQNHLLGGHFKISAGSLPGEVTIESLDPSKYELVIDDGSNGGKGTSVSKLTRATFAPYVLYFMTPFAEPTIERLLDFPMPVTYGGQVSQATVDAEKKKIKGEGVKRVFTGNVKRINGDSVNLSIDYLAAASGSDLEAFPRRPTNTPVNAGSLQGIWKRFENGLTNQFGTDKCNLAGFKKTIPDPAVIPYLDILTATTTYPGGGKAPTSRKCVVYSLNLVGAVDPKLGLQENRDYAAAISEVRPDAPVQRS